jgi:capsular polysaccharide biosynthesis protein
LESAVTSGRNAQMIIVDPAYKPTHPNKGRTQLVLVGTAAATALALLLSLLLALLDDHIYDRTDIELLRVAPLLGVVPRADGKRNNRG